MTVAETGEGGPRRRRVRLTRMMFVLGEFGNAAGIVLRAAPRLFAAGLSCSAVMGALPAAALYTNSRLIASLVAQDGCPFTQATPQRDNRNRRSAYRKPA